MFAPLKQGDQVRTTGGGTLTFIAYVPEAVLDQRVVMFDPAEGRGDILTYWYDGRFLYDRSPCGLDLIL